MGENCIIRIVLFIEGGIYIEFGKKTETANLFSRQLN